MPNFPAAMLAEMRAESEEGAHAAIERFEAAAKRSAPSSEHRLVVENELRFASTYSRLARRFDLSILMQSDPDRVNNGALINASLFDTGRPLVVVPYI